MVTTAYDIGDLRRLTVAFTDAAGTATDPTGVTVTIRSPDGTLTTKTYAAAQVVKSATGSYYYDFTVAQAGRHVARWEGTGALVVAEETEFWARRKQAV